MINIPGPSMAAFYGLDWMIHSIVCKWLGIPLPKRPVVQAELEEDLSAPPFFERMAFVELSERDGKYFARPHERGEKGRRHAMSAEGVFVSSLGKGGLKKGEIIRSGMAGLAQMKERRANKFLRSLDPRTRCANKPLKNNRKLRFSVEVLGKTFPNSFFFEGFDHYIQTYRKIWISIATKYSRLEKCSRPAPTGRLLFDYFIYRCRNSVIERTRACAISSVWPTSHRASSSLSW